MKKVQKFSGGTDCLARSYWCSQSKVVNRITDLASKKPIDNKALKQNPDEANLVSRFQCQGDWKLSITGIGSKPTRKKFNWSQN